jgi:hypothetical protein
MQEIAVELHSLPNALLSTRYMHILEMSAYKEKLQVTLPRRLSREDCLIFPYILKASAPFICTVRKLLTCIPRLNTYYYS